MNVQCRRGIIELVTRDEGIAMLRKVKIVDRGRGPQLDRSRITVYDIIPFLEAGDSDELIASSFLISSDLVATSST